MKKKLAIALTGSAILVAIYFTTNTAGQTYRMLMDRKHFVIVITKKAAA